MAHERHLTTWDFWILRIIAVYHLLKSMVFFALGFGLIHFSHTDPNVFLNTYVLEPLHFDTAGPFVHRLQERLSDLNPHLLRLFGYVSFVYATVFAIEGVGLYLRKRWAEYMVVIVVSSLLVPELYEIWLKFAWWKVGLTFGNVLVVAFLLRQIVVGKPKHK